MRGRREGMRGASEGKEIQSEILNFKFYILN
jgi:hypothetical protein